jgi:hypothetical protein
MVVILEGELAAHFLELGSKSDAGLSESLEGRAGFGYLLSLSPTGEPVIHHPTALLPITRHSTADNG